MDIHEFLRQRREARDLTQAELATLVGSSAPTICNYETGARTPGLSTLKRLSVALRFSLGDLDRLKGST